MKTIKLIFLCLLLVLLSCVTICNGQAKTNLRKQIVVSPEKVTETSQKMIRTQGVLSGNVMCELQDRSGNIWFSTGGEGIYRYNGKSFTNFTTKDGLADNAVSKIIQDKAGDILIGTKKGICRYDGKSFSKYSENAEMNNISISSMLEDREGNIWFGTLNSGVYRYDGKTLTNFLNNDDHPFNLGTHYQAILDILQDKSGDLWFSSWNGGGVWRYDGKKFTNFLPSPDYYQLKDGRSEDGRSIQNTELRSYTYLPNSYPTSIPENSISDDMIFSISEDKAGNLWFATRRHGACRYDGKNFKSFREAEGFVSKGIYSILEDKIGNIWLTTNESGIWCYNPSTASKTGSKPFKNFTTKDGLISNSVFSILEDKNGNLWFGTRGFGLNRYNGKSFTTFSN